MELDLLEEYKTSEEKLLDQLRARNTLPPRGQIVNLPKEYLKTSLWENVPDKDEDVFDELIEELNEIIDDKFNEASHLNPNEFRTVFHALIKQISVFDSVVEQTYLSLNTEEDKEEVKGLFEKLMGAKLEARIEKISEMEDFSGLEDKELYPKSQLEAFYGFGKKQNSGK